MKKVVMAMGNHIISIKCKDCGMAFVFTVKEQKEFKRKNFMPPVRCRKCRKIKSTQRRTEIEEQKRLEQKKIDDEKWQKNQKKFTEKLNEWEVCAFKDIAIDDSASLYIIGNGFDMLHGAKSSYYSFRDSLGKYNAVRTTLELYFDTPNLWGNLEEALANFNLDLMCSSYSVHDQLDLMDAYDEDASAADFFCAIETSVEPMRIVSQELPKAFRSWIESLAVRTDDRPLNQLFGSGNGKVLNFNYTEFVETLYGVKEENVCYIHGCRKKKSGKRKERLILGHSPGAGNNAYRRVRHRNLHRRGSHREYLLEAAQDNALHLAAQYDDTFTKKSDEIIQSKKDFFDGLKNIKSVVVIGHSMSWVDVEYFIKIAECIDNENTVWYIGCYGLNDLLNLEKLTISGIVAKKNIRIFRSDCIKATIYEDKVESKKHTPKPQTEKIIADDGISRVSRVNNCVMIYSHNILKLEMELPVAPHKAVLVSDKLLLSANGGNPAVYLFAKNNEEWILVNELLPPGDHYIINNRLRHVYIDDNSIRFIYNNRIYEYDLQTGALVRNVLKSKAKNGNYPGIDVFDQLKRY